MYAITTTVDSTTFDLRRSARHIDGDTAAERTPINHQGLAGSQATLELTIGRCQRTVVRGCTGDGCSILLYLTICTNSQSSKGTAIEDSLAAGHSECSGRTAKRTIRQCHIASANGQCVAKRVTIEIKSYILVD